MSEARIDLRKTQIAYSKTRNLSGLQSGTHCIQENLVCWSQIWHLIFVHVLKNILNVLFYSTLEQL